MYMQGFQGGTSGQESTCQCRRSKRHGFDAGDLRDVYSVPELGRSLRGGHGNPLQYSCLENSLGHKELDMTEVTLHVHMHLYMYGCFILLYSRNQHNTVKQSQYKLIKKKCSVSALKMDMSGECVISSVLSRCSKYFKQCTSVTAQLHLRVLFGKQRKVHP